MATQRKPRKPAAKKKAAVKKVDPSEVAKVLTHPLRIQIVKFIRDATSGMASPSEVAKALDAPLGNVSYHIRQLDAMGFLKLEKRTPRRGAIEHHYALEPVASKIIELAEAMEA